MPGVRCSEDRDDRARRQHRGATRHRQGNGNMILIWNGLRSQRSGLGAVWTQRSADNLGCPDRPSAAPTLDPGTEKDRMAG